MAIYTKLEEKDINNILSNYSIGKLKFFKGIQEGIENTNYYLLVEEKKYILTIYEKRVNPEDLPFFSELMTDLDNKNVTISDYKGKKLMIVSFLEGKAKQILTPNDCKQVGVEVARMHEITKGFKIKRSNNLSVKSWRNLFNSIKDQCTKIDKDLPKLIESNLVI